MVPARSPAPAVTELLRAVQAGNTRARDELETAVYSEMRSLTRNLLAGERSRGMVSPTELVHGAALKLMVQQKLAARDRSLFVACSARVMRQVLAEHTRADASHRHRGAVAMTLVSTPPEEPKEEIDFAALNTALDRLAAVSPEEARLLELRYFGGMTIQEIAELDGTPASTVLKNWQAARARLHEALAA